MGYRGELFNSIEAKELKINIEKVTLAYEFAKEAHHGQLRKSGEEYILHPIEVAKILIHMKMDTDTVVAGILHDVVEDTLITTADISYHFGNTVAMLVDGVTKLKNLPEGTQKQHENIRKMIVAMAKDIRVVIIKLADRLHNMRTLKHMKPEKQKKIAKETLEIFAPLAHRIGMAKIKWELEDLSFYYLEPKIYRDLVELVSLKRKEREEYTTQIMSLLTKEKEKEGINCEITGRPKHFYSIYKKMQEKNKNFSDIYDLIAVRVITKTEAECYNVLGLIHNLWTPVPGRFKDYIAVPKANGYQSIHTLVIASKGQVVEIQIRTEEMHRIAEDGVAAHWKYKEKVGSNKSDNVYSWLKQILDWQLEADDSEEFVKTVTADLLGEEVFVFTPKGDVQEMRKGATPLDFAYHVHTEVGHRCVGARVNSKIVPLNYELKNGDIVDIITSKTSKGPGKDWLKIVVTHSAKTKIRKWFKDMMFDEKVKDGKNILEKDFAIIGIKAKEIEELEEIQFFIKKNNIPNYNELLFRIGTGKISVLKLLDRVKKEEKIVEVSDKIKPDKKEKRTRKKNDYGIVIDGVDNTVIRFAKCCTPLPGDDISGYITRGNGIAIHRKDCKNFLSLEKYDRNRVLDVQWEDEAQEKNAYNFKFKIITMDRVNILIDIMNVISETKVNIVAVNSVSFVKGGDNMASIEVTIEIRGKEQFDRIAASLQRLRDIVEVVRS